MSVNKINPIYNPEGKQSGNPVSAEEWNALTQAVNAALSKLNEVIDEGISGGSSSSGDSTAPVDTSGVISINNKGNATIGNNNIKNINIEPGYPYNQDNSKFGDIALKPGDDILFCSHHREPKKRDKVVLKAIDGEDNPVKMQMVAGELDLAVGTENNPKTATRKKDKTTGADILNEPLFKASDSKIFDLRILTGNTIQPNTDAEREERAYLKVRAQAFDLRCEKHGGIALQPKGYDGEGNMNKIKFEHGGGDGLEFGTFNSEKTSIFTDEYRFNKYGIWKMATRRLIPNNKVIYDDNTPAGKESTAAYKYEKLNDDFYDVIDELDEQCTTDNIIKTAYALNGHKNRHTKITDKGNIEIAAIESFSVAEYAGETTGVDVLYDCPSNVLDPAVVYNRTELAAVTGDEAQFVDYWLAADLENNKISPYSGSAVIGLSTAAEAEADETNTKYYTITAVEVPKINLESENAVLITSKQIELKASDKLKLGGILDFGSNFNFGETDEGIEFQYKLTKKNVEKDCGVLKFVGVNNHASNNLTVEGVTIAPGQTGTIAQCSILDIIKLVNYMKTNNQGPWTTPA